MSSHREVFLRQVPLEHYGDPQGVIQLEHLGHIRANRGVVQDEVGHAYTMGKIELLLMARQQQQQM